MAFKHNIPIPVLIFGLIEAQTRAALGDNQQLPGLLPEGRAARPTGRNILSAFQGLGLTYTWSTSIPAL